MTTVLSPALRRNARAYREHVAASDSSCDAAICDVSHLRQFFSGKLRCPPPPPLHPPLLPPAPLEADSQTSVVGSPAWWRAEIPTVGISFSLGTGGS